MLSKFQLLVIIVVNVEENVMENFPVIIVQGKTNHVYMTRPKINEDDE